jgi:hypothetical protein
MCIRAYLVTTLASEAVSLAPAGEERDAADTTTLNVRLGLSTLNGVEHCTLDLV